MVVVNDGDGDVDGVPDYADGYNLDGGALAADDAGGAAGLVPLKLTINGGLDSNSSTLTFSYSASTPPLVAKPATELGEYVEYAYQLPEAGRMRLWTANAASRNMQSIIAGGQFVPSGLPIRLLDLGYSGSSMTLTLYVEAVGASYGGPDSIQASLSVTGIDNTTITISDVIHATLIGIDADVDSDNDGVLEKDLFEDHIEHLGSPVYPGKAITVGGDPTSFTDYAVSLNGPISVSTASIRFQFNNALIRLRLPNGEELVPNAYYSAAALPFIENQLALAVEGLPAILSQQVGGISLDVSVILSGLANLGLFDRVIFAGLPAITGIEFLTPNVQIGGSLFYGVLEDNPDGMRDPETGDHVGAEPAFMGGHAFFPDASSGGQPARNAVLVRARVSPNTRPGVDRVYFKSFDVDDPDPRSEIDPNDGGDRNGKNARATGWDNRGGGRHRGNAGRLQRVDEQYLPVGDIVGGSSMIEATVVDRGGAIGKVAEIILYTSMYAGDNFRVAATFVRDRLLVLRNDGGRTMVPTKDSSSASDELIELQQLKQGGAITPQLSVWRHLYMETDRMKAIAAHGDDAALGGIIERTHSYSEPFQTFSVDVAGIAMRENGKYEGGTLRVHDTVSNSVTDYAIINSRANRLSDGAGPNGPVPGRVISMQSLQQSEVWVQTNFPTLDPAVRQFAGGVLWVHDLHSLNSFGDANPQYQTWLKYPIIEIDTSATEGFIKVRKPITHTIPAGMAVLTANSVTFDLKKAGTFRPLNGFRADAYDDDYIASVAGEPQRRIDPSSDAVRNSMFSLMQATKSLDTNRFAAAYIQPEYNALANPRPVLSPNSQTAVSGKNDAFNDRPLYENRDTPASVDAFWTAYVTSAYQAIGPFDADGHYLDRTGKEVANFASSGLFGLSGSFRGGWSAVFVEAARDLNAMLHQGLKGRTYLRQCGETDLNRGAEHEQEDLSFLLGRITAHEVGHQIGRWGHSSEIMGFIEDAKFDDAFVPGDVAIFRSRDVP